MSSNVCCSDICHNWQCILPRYLDTAIDSSNQYGITCTTHGTHCTTHTGGRLVHNTALCTQQQWGFYWAKSRTLSDNNSQNVLSFSASPDKISDKNQILSDNVRLWSSLADILKILNLSFFFKIGLKLTGVWKTILTFVESPFFRALRAQT